MYLDILLYDNKYISIIGVQFYAGKNLAAVLFHQIGDKKLNSFFL